MTDKELDVATLVSDTMSLNDMANFDLVPISITATVGTTIVYANQAAHQLLGASAMVGHSAYEFSAVQHHEFLVEFVGTEQAAPNLGPVTRQTATHSDGRWIELEVASRRIILDGEEARLHAFVPVQSPDVIGELIKSNVELGDRITRLEDQLAQHQYQDMTTKKAIWATLGIDIAATENRD